MPTFGVDIKGTAVEAYPFVKEIQAVSVYLALTADHHTVSICWTIDSCPDQAL